MIAKDITPAVTIQARSVTESKNTSKTDIGIILSQVQHLPTVSNSGITTVAVADNTSISGTLSVLNTSAVGTADAHMTQLSIEKEKLFDFDNELDERVAAFMIWHNEPHDIIQELTNKLCCMYLFSGSSMIKEFLVEIVNTAGVNDIIKIQFAKTLCSQTESSENMEILDNCIQLIENTPIVILIECVILLMKSPEAHHQTNALEYFTIIINNQEHDQHFRYKTILSLGFMLSTIDDTLVGSFIHKSLRSFLDCSLNTSTYRIIAGQTLLQKYFKADSKSDESDDVYQSRDHIQRTIMMIMTDEDLAINVRADAADVLLNLGDGVYQENAREIILRLGAINGTVHNVYQDGQNIHATEIEKSALEILERLDIIEKSLTFEKARLFIMKLSVFDNSNPLNDDSDIHNVQITLEKDHSDTQKMVTVALNRIQIDRQLFSKYSISLKGILMRVLTFCNSSEHKFELYNRLLEELIDMHDKCSSGFAFRLVNVLSGYCEHAIRISWADQIAGNLSGRLNYHIRHIKDETYQEQILNEMCLNTDSAIGERKSFLRFFRESLPSIREEMWEVFENDVSDTEFDLYMRRAIAKYEGHEWI